MTDDQQASVHVVVDRDEQLIHIFDCDEIALSVDYEEARELVRQVLSVVSFAEAVSTPEPVVTERWFRKGFRSSVAEYLDARKMGMASDGAVVA